MNRLVFILAVLGAMGVVGGLLYFVSRPPAPAVPVAEERAPVPDAPAAAEPPSAARAPSSPREAPEPAPAPPPASVEAPDMGTLRIDSDVPGAQVFVDRAFIGETPAMARNLTPGSHRINVEAPGFDGVVQTVDVEPGERELFVPLRAVDLDASLAVEHKHGIGSCRGQLTATADGLHYLPTDGDDRFSVALTDLETFEVDYLERNLRVKIRGGRQYNFTDPEGNADRLFVFHRDVDRARARLLQGDPVRP